jgi:uncharacterized protein YggE
MRHISESRVHLRIGVGAVASLFAAALLASNSYAETSHRPHLMRRAISVTGECLTRVAQDRGAVTVTSSIVAKTPQEASSKTIASHEAIKSEVKRLSLRDASAETVVYSVFEECAYDGSRRSCTGFRAHAYVQVHALCINAACMSGFS